MIEGKLKYKQMNQISNDQERGNETQVTFEHCIWDVYSEAKHTKEL